MTGAPIQLPLKISLRDEYTLANFLTGPNAAVLDALRHQATSTTGAGGFVYCWGEAGVGKSHLLQAACHVAAEHDLSAIYLPLSELADLGPAMLDGLEQLDLVCIDDVQAIAGSRAWEEGLFNLYNRMREASSRLLLAANTSPRGLGIGLPDLISRFSQCLVVHVQALEPDQCIEVFLGRAGHRGIEVQGAVAEFIANRASRDLVALMQLLEELDHAQLTAKRKLTVPFVKQVMGW